MHRDNTHTHTHTHTKTNIQVFFQQAFFLILNLLQIGPRSQKKLDNHRNI